jgi:hypothetical protein
VPPQHTASHPARGAHPSGEWGWGLGPICSVRLCCSWIAPCGQVQHASVPKGGYRGREGCPARQRGEGGGRDHAAANGPAPAVVKIRNRRACGPAADYLHYVRGCVGAWVRGCVRVRVRARVRACVGACVRVTLCVKRLRPGAPRRRREGRITTHPIHPTYPLQNVGASPQMELDRSASAKFD